MFGTIRIKFMSRQSSHARSFAKGFYKRTTEVHWRNKNPPQASVGKCVKRLIKSFITSSVWVPGPPCATGLCDRAAVMVSLSVSECGASASTEGSARRARWQMRRHKKDWENAETIKKEERGWGREGGRKTNWQKREWYVVPFWGGELEMIYKSCENPFQTRSDQTWAQITAQWTTANNAMNYPSFFRPVACAEDNISKE